MASFKRFLLVEFEEMIDNELIRTMSIIPREWAKENEEVNKVSVWWPNTTRIPTEWILKGKQPDSNWIKTKGKIIVQSNQFKKIQEAEKSARESTDIELSESDVPTDLGRGKRKKCPRDLMSDLSSSDDEPGGLTDGEVPSKKSKLSEAFSTTTRTLTPAQLFKPISCPPLVHPEPATQPGSSHNGSPISSSSTSHVGSSRHNGNQRSFPSQPGGWRS